MRTNAQIIAAERDGCWCVWSQYGSENPVLLPATDVHHLARRQPGADLPECCISLNSRVHQNHHAGLGPRTSELLDLMLMLYGYDLRKDFPAFFGKY